MERNEQCARSVCDATRSHLNGAAARLNAYQIAILDSKISSIGGRQFHPGLRRCRVQFRRPASLGPGVEVVDGPTSHQTHRVRLVRSLGRRHPVSSLEPGPAIESGRSVLGGGNSRTGHKIMPVRLALVVVGHEVVIEIETLRAIRRLCGARPLDARTAAKPVIAQAGVVAGPATGAFAPGIERLLRGIPGRQRPATAIGETHPPGVVQPNLKITPCLSGRSNCTLGQMDRTVGVGIRTSFLAPERRRQSDIGVRGRFGQVAVADDQEQGVLAENPADPGKLGQ